MPSRRIMETHLREDIGKVKEETKFKVMEYKNVIRVPSLLLCVTNLYFGRIISIEENKRIYVYPSN